MNLLKIIYDKDIGEDVAPLSAYKERKAARAIVFDNVGAVALLYATKRGYHKLPGGGIESGEDIVTALARELSEEIGCAATNMRELGIIEEYRNRFSLHQTSCCFLADLEGEKGTPHLEEDEIADGFETVWVSLDDAVALLESETDIQCYEGKFIRARDFAFLKAVQEMHI